MAEDGIEHHVKGYLIYDLIKKELKVLRKAPRNPNPALVVISIDLKIVLPPPAKHEIKGTITLSPARKVDIVSSIMSEYDEEKEVE